jgi:hypothetical protein
MWLATRIYVYQDLASLVLGHSIQDLAPILVLLPLQRMLLGVLQVLNFRPQK